VLTLKFLFLEWKRCCQWTPCIVWMHHSIAWWIVVNIFLVQRLLLIQEFWSLSFEDRKTYGLDIPKRLHMKGDRGQWKFIIIQCVNICEIVWYQIIGLLRSTYMLYKSNNKWGCQFLSHHNKGTHKLQISTK
jgi:hypothetical protein